MTESITPRPDRAPEVRFQPSMLSVPSAAATVPPESQAAACAQRRARRKLWWFAALSALTGATVASLLQNPAHVSSRVQSGSPGYKQSPSGKDLHWKKRVLTIYLDDSLHKVGPAAHDAVMQAFGQWVASDTRLPDVRFDTGGTSTSPKQDGKSTVSYGPITAPGHAHDVAITITYSSDNSGEIIEADIILNSLYPMGVLTPKPVAQGASVVSNDKDQADRPSVHDREESLDCKNRYDAQNVTTHEAGHFFGLGEDPVEQRAAMFQTIDQCETHKRTLAATDVAAVGPLYAESAAPEEPEAGAQGCNLGAARSNGGPLWLSAGIFAFGLLRRRRGR